MLLRNTRNQVFYKKAAIKNSAISAGKHLCWSLFNILREESNVEKSPTEQKKNADLVQNSHPFIPHFLNHCHHSHSLILQFF